MNITKTKQLDLNYRRLALGLDYETYQALQDGETVTVDEATGQMLIDKGLATSAAKETPKKKGT